MNVVQITPHSVSREMKANIALSAPMMIAWIIYAFSPFAGTAMVAHLGPNALAASVLVATIWIAGTTFCFGIFHSVSVLVSQQFGAKNNNAISEIMGQTFMMCILSWLPVMLLMWSVPYLIHWSAPNKEILHFATLYAHALLWAAPGLVTLAMMEHYLSGIAQTRLSLWISILEVPFEIVIMYVLVFGKFGIPALGIQGVGYGLAICYTFTAIILLIYLHNAKFNQSYRIFQYVGKVKGFYWKEMLRIGLPIGFTYFIELIAFTIATYFISRFNATSLAAQQLILQFEAVIINIPYALSQGTSIRVGQSVGRLDMKGVWYASYVGIALGTGAAVMIALILMLLPKMLLSIDIDIHLPENQALVQQTIILFIILAIYQIFDSIRVAEAGALRGLKETRYTMLVNIFCFFGLGLFAAYLFGIVFNYQIEGVWIGLTIGMLVGAIALFLKLKKILATADLAQILHIRE